MIDIPYDIIIRKLNLTIKCEKYNEQFRTYTVKTTLSYPYSVHVDCYDEIAVDDMNGRRRVWATSQVSLLLDR